MSTEVINTDFYVHNWADKIRKFYHHLIGNSGIKDVRMGKHFYMVRGYTCPKCFRKRDILVVWNEESIDKNILKEIETIGGNFSDGDGIFYLACTGCGGINIKYNSNHDFFLYQCGYCSEEHRIDMKLSNCVEGGLIT